jgi:hypothetical protein
MARGADGVARAGSSAEAHVALAGQKAQAREIVQQTFVDRRAEEGKVRQCQ